MIFDALWTVAFTTIVVLPILWAFGFVGCFVMAVAWLALDWLLRQGVASIVAGPNDGHQYDACCCASPAPERTTCGAPSSGCTAPDAGRPIATPGGGAGRISGEFRS